MIVLKENQNLKKEFNNFRENCLGEIEKLHSKISKLEKENGELKEKINNIAILFQENKKNNEDNSKKYLSLFKESKIISQDESKEFLIKILNKTKIKTKLLYSATIDGDTIDAFNKKCNGKASTLTIIKTDNGKIIGGFFQKRFSVKDDYYDPDCFLFSLNYKEKYDVDQNGSDKGKSFFGTGSRSAIIDFGIGSSIHIVNQCLNNSSYYRAREGTFKFPKNRITSSDIHFIVIEFEVYQIEEIY